MATATKTRRQAITVAFIEKCDKRLLPKLLKQAHVDWIHRLQVAAAIIVRMESEGMKIPKWVRFPRQLRKIHEGKMLPALYAKVLAETDTLPVKVADRLADCSLDVQRKALSGSPLPYVDDDGNRTEVLASEIKSRMISSIFGNKKILSWDEQEERRKERDALEPLKPYEVLVNEGAVRFIRPCTVERAELEKILKQLGW